MSIESLAAELRALRRRIDTQAANQHIWPTKDEERASDFDRYDRRLLKAAAMLGVEAPSSRGTGHHLLSDDERFRLEERLVDANLDVRADPGENAVRRISP